ncbi:LCP family protein [Microaerobacter geothermalis]|uniref:LCP family protein n=1 Tax=Microaerobacter geothermalis TaxID=674972 RepID=UPI001F1B58DF|nr:LCP family protein [Microaerobacter geothermalis]MCF6092591.1 LCP family protein [Microaerobacter geothermalis]
MKKFFLYMVTILILSSFFLVGYGAYQYNTLNNRWYQPLNPPSVEDHGTTGTDHSSEPQPVTEREPMEPFTILMMGVDSRGEKNSRSDTIMLAAVNPEKQKVLLFSLPRDTYVNIPGYGYEKLNHSMFFGGPGLVKQTVEKFLDIKIDHYVTVDFEGFRLVIDELGGIEIDVEKRMKYIDPTDGTNIDLQPGEQILDGKNALDYARYRLSSIGGNDSDFQRMERQQKVIKAMIDKGTQFTSLFKVFSIMDIMGDHVRTDLTQKQISTLITRFADFSSDKIETTDVRGVSQRMPYTENLSLWFYVVDDGEKARLKEMIEKVLN